MRIDISQLEFIEPMLRDILVAIEHFSGLEFTLTSLYRIDDSGVHGTLPLRGADIRARNVTMCRGIVEWINDQFVYDPERPEMKAAIMHDTGNGIHIHIQVHPNTDVRHNRVAH